MWDDIQLSKGTWRDREVKVSMIKEGIQGEATLMYRSAPCNGVKICSVKGCNYVAPMSAQRPCPTHSQKLVKSSSITTGLVQLNLDTSTQRIVKMTIDDGF